jgi:hypothetical protein
MTRERSRGRAAVALVLLVAVASIAPASRADRPVIARFTPPAVYTQALSAVEPCLTRSDAECVRQGSDLFFGRLSTQIEALPSGRAGLAGWLRFAAALHQGSAPASPVVGRVSLEDALLAVYAAIGFETDAPTMRRMHRQVARLSPAESAEIADFVGAFVVSLRLAERARGDSGIERWAGDPRRADALAKEAMRSPESASEEARALLVAMRRVDMVAMTQASLVVADALARLDVSHMQDTIDLPFVFIGGDGDTEHTEDRVLLIDRSGNDTYYNNAGGGLLDFPRPPEDVCDLNVADQSPCLSLYPLGGSFAADFGSGDDTYEDLIGAQGWAWGAVGILFDEGGSDRYHLVDAAGHGAGYAGVGVLYDEGSNDDRYLTIWEKGELTPVATNGAALVGMGLLVDEGGSDVFRQDGVDGVAYGAGGGLGILASLASGDDVVRSDGTDSIFLGPDPVRRVGVVQGNAEVNGVGILYDVRGNERYLCNGKVRQGCQGVGADSSLGLLWDRAGDDLYFGEDALSCDVLRPPGCEGLPTPPDGVPVEAPIVGPIGQGAGYMTVPPQSAALGVLYDEGGYDRYVAPKWAQGYGALGNLGLLYDAGGGFDEYETRAPLVGARANGTTWLDGQLGIGLDR